MTHQHIPSNPPAPRHTHTDQCMQDAFDLGMEMTIAVLVATMEAIGNPMPEEAQEGLRAAVQASLEMQKSVGGLN